MRQVPETWFGVPTRWTGGKLKMVDIHYRQNPDCARLKDAVSINMQGVKGPVVISGGIGHKPQFRALRVGDKAGDRLGRRINLSHSLSFDLMVLDLQSRDCAGFTTSDSF